MSRNQVINLVKIYVKHLEENLVLPVSVYLFGSYAKKSQHKNDSDIDIAVIVKEENNKYENLLWKTTKKVDTRIEPILFTEKDFTDDCDPLVYEIKTNGIKIM